MEDITYFIESLKEKGLKITSPRFTISRLLMDCTKHPSAEDIYNQVLEVHPGISFTTVYKNLKTFADLGLIDELSIDPERIRYDPNTTPHYHSLCWKCGNIRDHFPDNGIAPLPSNEKSLNGFKVKKIQVHFRGICPGCSEEPGYQI